MIFDCSFSSSSVSSSSSVRVLGGPAGACGASEPLAICSSMACNWADSSSVCRWLSTSLVRLPASRPAACCSLSLASWSNCFISPSSLRSSLFSDFRRSASGGWASRAGGRVMPDPGLLTPDAVTPSTGSTRGAGIDCGPDCGSPRPAGGSARSPTTGVERRSGAADATAAARSGVFWPGIRSLASDPLPKPYVDTPRAAAAASRSRLGVLVVAIGGGVDASSRRRSSAAEMDGGGSAGGLDMTSAPCAGGETGFCHPVIFP